jgi:hypothetical protein
MIEKLLEARRKLLCISGFHRLEETSDIFIRVCLDCDGIFAVSYDMLYGSTYIIHRIK